MSEWIRRKDAISVARHISMEFMDTIGRQMLIEQIPYVKTKEVKYFDEDEKAWKIGEVIVNSSEKPNNLSEISTSSIRRAPITALEVALSECKARHNGCENCTTECAWRE